MFFYKASGSTITFPILYVVDILTHGIRIYIDRSWQLKGLSKIALIVKDLKELKIKDSNRAIFSNTTWHVFEKNPSVNVLELDNIPYAATIGLIIYVMIMHKVQISRMLRAFQIILV